ncbi:MAG: class I SAM-dependent methyltransferase [Desulfomonile sp.]|nr:class I SAM-dependent methyltransferase [Desulfomonile sp.]
MNQDNSSRIKSAIRENFNQSPDRYQEFEDRYGFFRNLNEILLSRMELSPGSAILDVGCGTGASSLQIADFVPDSRVWGLDISPAMLEVARTRAGNSGRFSFVEGDAARLAEYFDVRFDAIVYAASIFLVPDFRQSLSQACELLKEGGKVGLTFMDGVYTPGGVNAFAEADQKAKVGVSFRKPVKLPELQSFFETHFTSPKTWQENLDVSSEMLKDFYSVPAMSAGLFPGRPYPERVERVRRLIDHLPAGPIVFRWMIMVGLLVNRTS